MKKTLKRVVSGIMTITMIGGAVSAPVNAAVDCSDLYGTTLYGFEPTFAELLEMSDDEFLELDKCREEITEQSLIYTNYKYAGRILGLTSQMFMYEDLENIPENLMDLKSWAAEQTSFSEDEIKAIISREPDGSISNTFLAIGDLGDKIYYQCTWENIPSKIWLTKVLNDKIGDNINYELYYPKYPGYNENRVCFVYVKFDIDDKLELNKENFVYAAKLLCCLDRVDENFDYCHPADLLLVGSTDEMEIIDSSVKVGDANEDGELNIRDAAYISQKMAERSGEELSEFSDYNVDGSVNVRDAAGIARFMAEKSIPAEK